MSSDLLLFIWKISHDSIAIGSQNEKHYPLRPTQYRHIGYGLNEIDAFVIIECVLFLRQMKKNMCFFVVVVVDKITRRGLI